MHLAPSETVGLSAALRRATRQVHAEAERAGVMPALLQGRLPRSDYLRLLVNLRVIYAELEPALLRHREHACVAPICLPSLFRTAALTADIETLDDASVDRAMLVPASERYRLRLQTLDADDPTLLAAHAYVRYLGDLSGGQILARLVARSYGFSNGDGTQFYAFGPDDAVAATARELRSGLDTLPVSAEEAARIVDEAVNAFTWHGDLFRQLAAPP